MVRRQHGQQIRYLQQSLRGLVVLTAADLQERERAVGGTGLPERLGRSDFHRLVSALGHPQLAPDEHVYEDGGGKDDQRDDGGATERRDRVLPAQLPRRNGQHDDGSGDQRRQDHVRVGPQKYG